MTKRGISLLETIVTVAVLSIVLIGFSALIMRVWNSNRFAIETGIASLAADRGVSDAVKSIRKATRGENGDFPIVSAGEYELVFYSDYDGDDTVERVRYFVDGSTDEFRIGVTEPTGSPSTYNPGTDEVISQVAGFVVNNSTGDPAFAYYDNLNNEMTTVNVNNITMVEILIFVNIDQVRAPNNIRVQSRATIRNLSEFGDAPS